jgi:hypothetical protein
MKTVRRRTLKTFGILLTLVLVLVVLPASEVLADPLGQTLSVSEWSTASTAVATAGRPTVLKDGDTYHMWYGLDTNPNTLFYASSTDPANFGAGTPVVFFGPPPPEFSSVAVIGSVGNFTMITYEAFDPLFQSFAYWTSDDGINWNYFGLLFGVTGADFPDFTLSKIDCPFVMQDGSTYRLFFHVKSTDSKYYIYQATSPTLVGPWTLAGQVLAPGTSGIWDDTRVAQPWVVKEGGKYYMWYTGSGTGHTNDMGLATSTDGSTWTKSPGNPIIDQTNYVADASVIFDGTNWNLWYQSVANSAVEHISSTSPFEFYSIQAAVDAASAGDTIEVAAGTYVESLKITKDLTILGEGAGITIIQSPDTLPVCVTSSNDNKAIVCIEDSVVTLDGLTIDGLGKGNANYRFVGVGYHNAGGTLQNSEVLNIKNTPFSGDQHGVAVYSYNEDEKLYTINILDNTIADFQKNAITLNASDLTPLDVVVSRNTIVGAGTTSVTAQNGIQVWAMLGTGVVSDNNVSGIYYTDLDGCDWTATSILNYYADIDVTGNTITGAQEAIYPYLGTGDITGNTISVKRQDACWSDAIYVYHPTADMEISNNVMTYDDNGLTGYDSYGIAVSVGDDDINFIANNNQVNNFDYGIDLYRSSSVSGDLTTILLQNNDLHTSLADLWLEGELQADPTIEKNKFLGDALGVQNDLTKTVDASPNWWGSVYGPAEGEVIGDVDYAPWCAVEDCSSLLPVDGVIDLPSGVTAEEIQQVINNSPYGTTIIIPKGTEDYYNIEGGFVINNPGIKIILSDGVEIRNDSPCYTINASYTEITTASPKGAKCVPTDGSNGIDVSAGLVDIRIIGIEFDSDGETTGDGIHFAGAVDDVYIVNNYIHNLGGDGVEFSETPGGTVKIQGNMIKDNTTGVGVVSPDDIDVTYNAWGAYGGPTRGVDVSSNITSYDPWTHVDVYLESSGTVYADQVVNGNQITYAVKANLKEVMGAEVTLNYPTELDYVDSSFANGVLDHGNLNSDTDGKLVFIGYNDVSSAESGEDVTLFTVIFEGDTTGKNLSLSFDQTVDLFSMAPPSGVSNLVYADELVDKTLDVIELPTLSSSDLVGPYAITYPQEFTVSVSNPSAGVQFNDTSLVLSGFSDAVLKYWDGDSFEPITLSSGSGTFVIPDDLEVDQGYNYKFQVTFNSSGNRNLTVELYDTAPDPDWLLDSLSQTGVIVNDNYNVTGSITMQGRTYSGDIPVTLTHANGTFGLWTVNSVDRISNNVRFSNVPNGNISVTTNQPRYLNIDAAELSKTFNINGANVQLAKLELKGGNAVWIDNIINLLDASEVAGAYDSTGDINADVNFDLIVNIFDLALVGGNYGETSVGAYGTSWTVIE